MQTFEYTTKSGNRIVATIEGSRGNITAVTVKADRDPSPEDALEVDAALRRFIGRPRGTTIHSVGHTQQSAKAVAGDILHGSPQN